MAKLILMIFTAIILHVGVLMSQDLEYTVLPSIPIKTIEVIRVTQQGQVWVTGTTTNSRVVVFKDPNQPSWQEVSGTLRGSPDDKILHNNTLEGVPPIAFKHAIYYSSTIGSSVNGGPVKAIITTQKLEDGKITQLCNDLSVISGVTNGTPINTFRGVFPSPDGKEYYSGRRLEQYSGKASSGIYSWVSGTINCQFREVLPTDPRYEIFQVWNEFSGSFLVQRFPVNPTSLETEIVRYSLTGNTWNMTVLFSSNPNSQPQILTAPGCCSLTFDPDNQTAKVGYKGLENKYHIRYIQGSTMKEIHVSASSGPTQYGLQTLSLKLPWALIMGGQYGPDFDSLVLINTATGQSRIVYDRKTIIPGIPQGQIINLFFVDVDEKGNVYIGLLDGTGEAKIVQISAKVIVVPPLPPPPPDPALIPGTISRLTDLYGQDVATIPAAPGKIMTIWGTELCALRTDTWKEQNAWLGTSPVPTVLGGCQVKIDGILAQLYFAWTTSLGGSTQINLIVPSISTGAHTLVVEKMDKNVLFVSKTAPFQFSSVETSPMFFHPPNYPISLQNASRGSDSEIVFVSGDNPARPGDVLVAYSTGMGKGKVSITVNDRDADLLYAGPQGTYPGLDQINFSIPLGIVPVGGLGTLKVNVGGKVQTFLFNLTN